MRKRLMWVLDVAANAQTTSDQWARGLKLRKLGSPSFKRILKYVQSVILLCLAKGTVLMVPKSSLRIFEPDGVKSCGLCSTPSSDAVF